MKAEHVLSGVLLGVALVAGCGGTEVSTRERMAQAFAPRPDSGVLTTLTFEGEMALDPIAGHRVQQGPVRLHVYFLDDVLLDSMTCYGEPESCAIFELTAQEDGESWVASVAFPGTTTRPLALRYSVGRNRSFTSARTVDLQVFAAPHGEIGAARLQRAPGAPPRTAEWAHLRAQGRLLTAFQRLEERFEDPPEGEQRLPASRPEAPSPPPCVPVRVEATETLRWLGVDATTVLTWAYALAIDEVEGSLRITARRDPNCDGRYEEVHLEARIDAFGDLERMLPDAGSEAP